jgi:hypothetical protein
MLTLESFIEKGSNIVPPSVDMEKVGSESDDQNSNWTRGGV